MKLAQSTATPIAAPAPATFTCSQCPFSRHIDGNRYCCSVSQTASDVKRGHWEATVSCFEALAKAEAEAEIEAPVIAPTEPTSIGLATPLNPSPTALSGATSIATEHTATADVPAPTAIGTNDEPPNRGDNGRGRVQPIAAKKLLPSIVPVARIRSDIPATNFDQFELEILGELCLLIGGFIIPPVLVRHSSGYKVVAGHLQYHAAVLARQLNPRAGETIPAIVLEEENQAAALNQLKRLKLAA
jgi:hypothetical protein